MKKFAMLLVAIVLAIPSVSFAQDDVETLKKKLAEAEAAKAKVTEKVEKELTEKQDVAQHLQDISVTIVSRGQFGGGGEGSGVIKTRKMKDGTTVNFIWTAAHVVDNLRKTRTVIDSKSGTTKTVVEFDDAMVVKAIQQDGRTVGKLELMAEVVRYSAEQDLALLRLRKSNFVQSSVTFYLDDKIPAIGTDLLHVGSLLGQLGSNSMTTGIMSQHGRLIDKKVFDQTTVAAFPGSSGGGVYLKDGRMVGMLVRGAGETFNLIVPVRRLVTWAKHANIEWAVNDNVAMPTEEELRKMPVEDTGVEFSYSVKTEAAGDHGPSKVIIIGDGKAFYLGNRDTELKFPTYLKWNFDKKVMPKVEENTSSQATQETDGFSPRKATVAPAIRNSSSDDLLNRVLRR